MGRPPDRHIDDQQLNALVPWTSPGAEKLHKPSKEFIWEAERHAQQCTDCARKIFEYREIVNTFATPTVSEPAPSESACSEKYAIDWHQVAGGLWPELRAKQVIRHAALCDYCGPQLRTAVSIHEKLSSHGQREAAPSPRREPPSDSVASFFAAASSPWYFLKWWIPAVTLIVVGGMMSSMPMSLATRLSGQDFAEFAVRTHKQYAQGKLALEVRSDSQRILNNWFKEKAPFRLALPTSGSIPEGQHLYKLEGARLVQVAGTDAGFIAYQVQASEFHPTVASLIVLPDSVTVASGGTQVDFNKVSFHYARVERYRVVTWSVHGLTYAIVSQEENRTQRSCMVCHSALQDRDLSQSPTPFQTDDSSRKAVWQ